MKTLFLINPVAGRGSALKVWKRIEHLAALERGAEAVIPESAEATRKAVADAVRAGAERVIVVGGDGTLLLAVGELARTDTALGVIPAGTGNDFVRDYGLPKRPEEALAVALGPQLQRIDLGQTESGRYFLNAAGMGFDAQVAAKAITYPKGLGGHLPYLLGIFHTLVRYKPIRAVITVDDQRYEGDTTLIAVANGRYFGGGVQIAPTARRDDGMMDVYVAEGMGALRILGLLPRVYTGAHASSPKVHMLRGRQVQIEVGTPVPTHLDGEPLRWERLVCQAVPGALSIAAQAR